MSKIDYLKQLKHLYAPSAKSVTVVDVPPMNFLMIDGAGDPNTAETFKEAVEALFSVSYTLKFMVKKGESGLDYGVMPLQALWWSDDLSAFTNGNKAAWHWTVMVMQPDCISAGLVDKALTEVERKKKLVALPRMRYETFCEGKAAQTLHIGPFSAEGPTIEKVHAFIESSNCHRIGKHHEIYLSDIRRTAPEKWKTIVRQPMT